LSKIAHGVTAALTVAVVVELLHASVLLVFALTSLALDGKPNWLEGAMLCGVYAFAALVFFFSP
jgi:Ca2+/H+ antiporter